MVRGFRRRSGLTQQELADVAGLSVAALRDMEQGRVVSPRVGTLRRLGEVLGLSRVELEQLLGAGARPLGAGARSASGVSVGVLGPLRVVVDGRVVDPGSRIQHVLLGVLGLSPNVSVSRDVLIEVLWGAEPPSAVVALLQSRVSRLRRRLAPRQSSSVPRQSSQPGGSGSGSGLVVATPSGYRLNVRDDEHDVLVFRELVSRARQLTVGGDLGPAREVYAEAVGLWRGAPLAGLEALESHPVVVGLVREWQQVVVDYAGIAAESGRHDDVVPLLQQVADDDPLHEAAHAGLMIALAGSGQQAAALAVYDRLRRRLADELGADPSPELSAAYQRVLHQEVVRQEFAPVSAHRQLPPDIADFTGRAVELRKLHASIGVRSSSGTAIVISAIEGMAGVGKTRLAVRLAHQLVQAGRYGDEQLYVDLHGHAEQPPADPAAVLASFLRLLGVPGDQIPPDLDARAAMYRDRVYGKDMLVLLDNAASEAQVRPLLPASPSNLVVITSRRTLGLDGAHTLPLDVFGRDEAHALLTQILGAQRVDADPYAAQRVIELCGHLPLAVALAARRLQTRPSWKFTDLSARLEETANRLGQLAIGSRRLRSVFDLSYQALNPRQQRTFRLLGLHPGEDFDAYSTAALAGIDPGEAQPLLDELVDEHLLTMYTADRYRPHDLIREYARHLAHTGQPETDTRQALTRLLDYYLHTADHAASLQRANRWKVELVGTPPPHPARLRTAADAVEWMESERASLTAAVSLAAEHGWPTHAWQLAECTRLFLYQQGYVDAWVHTQEVALAAAVANDDVAGESLMRYGLGGGYTIQGRSEKARYHLERALDLHRQSGERELEVYTLNALGVLSARLGNFREALGHLQLAIERWDGRTDYPAGLLHNNIAFLQLMLGQLKVAQQNLDRSLVLSRASGDNFHETTALVNLGDVYRRLGRFDEAIGHLTDALVVTGDVEYGVAYARSRLGQTYRDMGRPDEALTELNEAVRIMGAVRGSGPGSECELLVDLASVQRDRDELTSAREFARAAFTMAVEGSERYYEARALSELAALDDREGHSEAALEHWRQAHLIFVELGVPEAEGGGGSPVRRGRGVERGSPPAAAEQVRESDGGKASPL